MSFTIPTNPYFKKIKSQTNLSIDLVFLNHDPILFPLA